MKTDKTDKTDTITRIEEANTSENLPTKTQPVTSEGNWQQAIGMAASAGFTLLTAMALFMGIGGALDSLLETSPVLLILFGSIGGVVGMYALYRRAVK